MFCIEGISGFVFTEICRTQPKALEVFLFEKKQERYVSLVNF